MINYIMEQWKHKKITIALIIFGFLIANLVLTIGTSISVENYKLLMDINSGYPEEQLIIKFDIEKENQHDQVLELLDDFSDFGELQLVYNEKAYLDDYKDTYITVPIIFKKIANWHIPILKGRYFIDEDLLLETKEIVIGRDIALKHHIKVNDILYVNSMSYKVVGICGRTSRDTIWQNVIYVPLHDYLPVNSKSFDEPLSITILLKEGKDKFITASKSMIEKAKKNSITITFQEYEGGRNFSSVTNSVTLTVVSSILIFTIAIINVTNLMIYWIIERQQSIGIMRALGASNNYLIRWTIIEISCMTFFSSILAIILQLVLSSILRGYLSNNQIVLQITLINIIVSSIIAFLCGIIAAILPTKQILKLNPADTMKYE